MSVKAQDAQLSFPRVLKGSNATTLIYSSWQFWTAVLFADLFPSDIFSDNILSVILLYCSLGFLSRNSSRFYFSDLYLGFGYGLLPDFTLKYHIALLGDIRPLRDITYSEILLPDLFLNSRVYFSFSRTSSLEYHLEIISGFIFDRTLTKPSGSLSSPHSNVHLSTTLQLLTLIPTPFKTPLCSPQPTPQSSAASHP